MTELGVAVIGCGYWGMNHVRVFNELPNSRVIAVCDQREERLQEVARRFQGIALTTSIEEALQMDGVEAAIVCTQPTSHFDVTSRCLELGKHALVEKPMTTTESDSQKLIALAKTNDVTLMVGHTFLYNSAVRKVKDYITQKKMDRVYYMYATRTNLGPIRQDVNALWDLAIHDIAIFNYLLDATPLWVSAVGSNILHNSREDVGFVSVGYENNVVGHIHVSWADPNKVRQVVVVGSNMRIVFDDINAQEQVRVFEKGVTPAPSESDSFGEYYLDIRDGDIISPKIEFSEPLKNQAKHFLDCVANNKRPLTSGEDGLSVVQVMNAVDRSMAQKGAPVQIGNGDY